MESVSQKAGTKPRARAGERAGNCRVRIATLRIGSSCSVRFANGIQAPIHVLDDLPEEWVIGRNESGRVAAVKDSSLPNSSVTDSSSPVREGRPMGQSLGSSGVATFDLDPCR